MTRYHLDKEVQSFLQNSNMLSIIFLFGINIGLLIYLFYKDHKNSQLIREILASKISQETFEKIVNPLPTEKEEFSINNEPLLDDVPAEDILKSFKSEEISNEEIK